MPDDLQQKLIDRYLEYNDEFNQLCGMFSVDPETYDMYDDTHEPDLVISLGNVQALYAVLNLDCGMSNEAIEKLKAEYVPVEKKGE